MATTDVVGGSRLPSIRRRQVLAGLAVVGFLVAVAIWALAERTGLLSTLEACRTGAGCSPARLAERTFASMNRLETLGLVSAALPSLAGAAWGAPMIARVAEKGSWAIPGDDTGRVRWFLARLAAAAGGTVVVAAGLGLLVAWWWSPAGDTVYGLGWYRPAIVYATGPAAVAAALCGLVIGAAVGLLLRRTLLAVMATVAVTAGARWVQYLAHRPGLGSPHRPAYWTVQWIDTAVWTALAVALTVVVARRLHQAPPAVPRALPALLSEGTVRAWLVPLVPGGFALGLGLWGLARWDSMWRDEAATWQVAHRSLPEIWHMLGEVDLVHGLYYVLMHGLFALFGDSLYTLRLPSVLAVVTATVLTARIGARLAGAAAGIGAGTVLAVVPAGQLYAQEGRSYALVLAGVAAATWLLIKGYDQPGRRGVWVLYALTVWISALLNWFCLLALGAHALTLLLARADRTARRRWALASGAAVVATLPLILASRAQSGQVSWIRPLSWSDLIAPAALLLIAGLCARIPAPGAGRLTPARLALPLLAVPHLALLLVSTVKPLYLDRYLLYTYLGLALLLGTALAAAVRVLTDHRYRQSWLLLPLAATAAVTVLYPMENRDRTSSGRVDDVLVAAQSVAYDARPGDAVLFLPAARRDTALVAPQSFAGLDDIALLSSGTLSGTLKGLERTPEQIRAAMLARKRIVLVTDAYSVARPPGTARERVKQQVLDQYFHPVDRTQSGGRRVMVYERD
ncbi:hypothetical protein ACGFZL_28050 [Streptomyces sp. NPDC048182]|uniref:glycosyltransferase family 39 protein n=1 Tax=Streptomyces sp. NPDC048182 TaxID=3365507 RepID=UPI0037224430